MKISKEEALANIKASIKSEALKCRWAQCQCGDPKCECVTLYDNKDRVLGMIDWGSAMHVVRVLGERNDAYVGYGEKRDLEELLDLPECPDGYPPWADIINGRRNRERSYAVYLVGKDPNDFTANFDLYTDVDETPAE